MKQRLRLVEFLGVGPAKVLAMKQGSEAACASNPIISLQRRDGKTQLASGALVRALEREDLLQRCDDSISLTKPGRAFLTRLRSESPKSGEKFAAQHREITSVKVRQDTGNSRAKVNKNESPLSRLHNRKSAEGKTYIDATAFEAGERLRRDFTIAGLMQRVTASWDMSLTSSNRTGRGGMADLSDSAIDARRRFSLAMDVLGPDLAGVLTDVCCFLKGLETVERERRWPPRSAKLMLRAGLDLLARHYGLIAQGKHHVAARQWGGDGYRPAMFPDQPD